MKAYVFPGQGAQFVGMGKDLYDNNPLAKEMFEKANEILGFRITDLMFAGTDEDLRQTKVTQPAIFLHSVILAKTLGDQFQPDMTAGHSLGEFSALVAAGALSVPEVLPAMKRKGLQLLINNALPAGEQRYGDREALRRTLVLLIQYSVTTTPIGKITLDVCQDESASDRLTFRILDTGNGVSANEIDNMHFPYLNETQSDLYGKANALTFWLCDRMTRKLGGQLTIKARESLGTRYTLHLKMPASEEAPEAGEHLLDDVIVLLDVTSSEVRRIVTRQLESWGASCITPDDRATSQAFDLYLTDNPSNLTASGLLLVGA